MNITVMKKKSRKIDIILRDFFYQLSIIYYLSTDEVWFDFVLDRWSVWVTFLLLMLISELLLLPCFFDDVFLQLSIISSFLFTLIVFADWRIVYIVEYFCNFDTLQ